jgi:hypothetical protein
MEVIILGNPFLEDSGTVTPIVVPAYKAEETVIELTNGYNPFVIGDNSGATIINVSRDTDITRLFTISNLVTNTLDLGVSAGIIIHSVNVNGIEYYESIDYNIAVDVITFNDYLPYDSTIGVTTVRVVYSLLISDETSGALTASMVPLDTSGFHQNLDNTVDDVQKLADIVDTLTTGGGGGTISKNVINLMSTGLLMGGVISPDVSSGYTRFNITDGAGVIVNNYTDSQNPVKTPVAWTGKSGIVIPHLNSTDVTYVSIDTSGNVIQQDTLPTASEFRDKIFLGAITHISRAYIEAVANTPLVEYDVAMQLFDFLISFGPFNINGDIFSANGANLFVNKSAGNDFIVGGNYSINKKVPNIMSTSSFAMGYIVPVWQTAPNVWASGSVGVSIDPEHYDSGAGLSNVPSSKFTIQTIFYDPRSNTSIIQYGQVVYDTLSIAEANISVTIALHPSTTNLVF